MLAKDTYVIHKAYDENFDAKNVPFETSPRFPVQGFDKEWVYKYIKDIVGGKNKCMLKRGIFETI